MKTLKQIKEEYDSNFLDQVEFLPEELTLEGLESLPRMTKVGQKLPDREGSIPSTKQMPVLLLFRRVQYRVFPNKQVVALYYSSIIDKYLSIPFGPGKNVNLSEATFYNTVEELNEDWQDVNRKDRTDGLSQKAVNAYRRENPGSKLQTAVTEKNPTGKRASRRKSFCSRMSGMKKRLTSAKTARDPDSRINKALRRWNCEESFHAKLSEMRGEQMNEGPVLDTIKGAAKGALSGGLKGAAIGYPGHLPGIAAGTAIGATVGAIKGGKKAYTKSKQKEVEEGYLTDLVTKGLKGIGGLALDAAGSAIKNVNDAAEKATTVHNVQKRPTKISKTSSWVKQRPSDAAFQSKLVGQAKKELETPKGPATKQVQENKMSDLRNMVKEGVDNLDLAINGRQVTLNTSMAKRILEVYDSVNTKNKKIVEGMLNEDLESFKKLLNFSIKA